MSLALLVVLLAVSPVWAQPSPALVEELIETANQTSYTIPSHTLTASRLILLAIYGRSGGALPTPTITGHSLTWTVVASVEQGAGVGSEIFLFCSKTTSGSTDTIVADYGATTMASFVGQVIEWSGADLTVDCDAALLQDKTFNADVTDTTTITFDAFSSSSNRPFIQAWKNTSGTATAESGWTELYDHSLASTTVNYGMWRNDTSDTTGTVTWSNTGSARALAIGVEIVAGAAGGGGGCIGCGIGNGGVIQ